MCTRPTRFTRKRPSVKKYDCSPLSGEGAACVQGLQGLQEKVLQSRSMTARHFQGRGLHVYKVYKVYKKKAFSQEV